MKQLNGYDETGVGEAVSMVEKRRDVFTGSGLVFVNGVAIGAALSPLSVDVNSEAESDKVLRVERYITVEGTISLRLYPAQLWRLRASINGWKQLPRGKAFRSGALPKTNNGAIAPVGGIDHQPERFSCVFPDFRIK